MQDFNLPTMLINLSYLFGAQVIKIADELITNLVFFIPKDNSPQWHIANNLAVYLNGNFYFSSSKILLLAFCGNSDSSFLTKLALCFSLVTNDI